MVLYRLGNKSRIAPRILPFIPEHQLWLEPFFGAGGLFFNKPRAQRNIVNDLDSEVFNLFTVVVDRRAELEEAWASMPIHEDLWKHWKKNTASRCRSSARGRTSAIAGLKCFSGVAHTEYVCTMLASDRGGCDTPQQPSPTALAPMEPKAMEHTAADARAVAFIKRFRGPIHYAINLEGVPHHQRDDLFQDASVRILQLYREGRIIEDAPGCLSLVITAVRNLCRNHWRTDRKHRGHAEMLEQTAAHVGLCLLYTSPSPRD